MALQVWLPLVKDGDFLNKGIADISATNNGATFSANNGKIGSCYYLDGTSNHHINTGYKTAFGTGDFTIAMWVKIPTITSGTYYAVATSKSSGANTVGVGVYWHYGNKKFLWSEATGSARYEIWTSETFTDIYDKWIHLVMIRNSDDEKKGYFYINGERHELASVPGIQDISTGTDLLLGKTSNNSYPIKAYYNDVRIYDHALSAKEVKEISKALVIHFKMDELSQDPISQIIYDSSGYGNNGTSAYAQQTFSSNTPRNSSCNLRTSSKSYVYCRINGNADYNNGNGWMVQGAEAMTVSEWAYATDWTNQTNCRLWSCTESGGWNTEGGSTGYLRIPINVYTNSGKTSYTYKYTNQEIELASLTPGWHMFTFTYEQSYGTKVYVDGELHSQNPYTSYGLHYNLTGSSLNLGAESTGIASASSPWFVGGLSDFRLYYTALSAEDIKELYEVSMSISSYGDVLPYELLEDDEVSGLTKAGVLQSSAYLGNGDWMPYDQTIYTEPDGSQWVKIVHHNNPASKLFGSGNTFATTVYIDEDRWFNASLCDSVNQWEFMVKEAVAADGTELKYRWIQDANPMTAVYADVGSAKITKYTSEDGYNNFTSGWGGIYKKNSNTFLSQNSGTASSWWGAIGSWTAYQGGIPGFGNNTASTHIIKTGYLDLYLRIDNLTFCETDSVARTYKNTAWSARQFIER